MGSINRKRFKHLFQPREEIVISQDAQLVILIHCDVRVLCECIEYGQKVLIPADGVCISNCGSDRELVERFVPN